MRRLEKIVRESLRFSWERRHLLGLLQRDERRFAMREAELRRRREGMMALVQRVILDGIERREFRGVDARIAAELLRGMIRAANCFRTEDDSVEGLAEEIIAIFTRGVGRRLGQAPGQST
jgi:hypothetical protein